MKVFYFFRILIVVAGLPFLFFVSRQLPKKQLLGFTWIATGIILMTANSIVAGLFYSGLVTAQNNQIILSKIGYLTGHVGQPSGLVMLLVGVYLLVHSIVPRLGSPSSSLLEQSFVGVYVIQSGVFKFVNHRLANMIDHEPAQLIGKRALDFLAPKYRRTVSHKIKEGTADEVLPVRSELQCVKRNGELLDIEFTASEIIYDGKRAIQGTVIDITERKQALDVILAGEERFTTLANSSFDIISETTAEGQFVYISENLKKILGYDAYELLGTKVLHLMHSEDLKKNARTFIRAIKYNSTVQAAFRYRHKSGAWHWFEGTGKGYETGGGERRMIIVARDITNKKKMEEEVFKASKLESIGLLAGGIAHDFNNILTVILGNISLAKSYFRMSQREPREILMEAETACTQAQELTNQFLTFSKGGDPVLRIRSISRLLRDTINFALRGSNVRCSFRIAKNLWLVEIDEGQIRQVIHNLVRNASQAMQDGGLIAVHARNQSFGKPNGLTLSEGDYVKIVVEDHGVGIHEENIGKIFDPYFTTKKEGSGLGLATAYSIVKNHGGLLTVESTVGVGTCFYLYLPAKLDAAMLSNSEESANKKEKPPVPIRKILLMDDEVAIRASVGRMLTRLGYEVTLAENGTEALQLYQHAYNAHSPYDAVVIDLTIRGGMGGKETIENLLKMDPGVKAVVSSGYCNDPIMADYKKFGFKGVIAKPYRFDDLGNILSQVIG